MTNITLQTKINNLTTKKLSLEKENKELLFLIDSQDRLINKLKKQNEEYVLLLDEMIRRKNDERRNSI